MISLIDRMEISANLALALPSREGHQFKASHDQCVFVSYISEDGNMRRVCRTYGKYLVLFRYAPKTSRYETYYLNADKAWILYEAPATPGANHDKVVTEWLRDHQAFAFKGKGWLKALTSQILDAVAAWEVP